MNRNFLRIFSPFYEFTLYLTGTDFKAAIRGANKESLR